MADLIRRRKTVMTPQSSAPPTTASAPTAPAQLQDMPVFPHVSRAPVSSESSVAQPVSARRHHRPPSTTDTTSTSAAGASGLILYFFAAKKNTRAPCRQLRTAKVIRVTNSCINIAYDEWHRATPTADQHSSLAPNIGSVVRTYCPMKWKSWKVMPDEVRMEVFGQLSTNYNLENVGDELLAYVNRLFAERYKQWKSDLHHHFQAYDDPQVALQGGCLKEFEGREDSWQWLCGHFQEADSVKNAKANKSNRQRKTLLHHSGSRPFSYRMEAWRQGGSKFPEIDVFGYVYVRLGNELAESLHTAMIQKSQLVLQELASQLPPDTLVKSVAPPQDVGFQILTETLDQTLGRRPGTYCRGMENARQRPPRPRESSESSSEVTALKTEVAELKGHLSHLLQSLAHSGIAIPSTSEPRQPEHGHHTSPPVHNVQTSEPHLPDDNVDLGGLFD
ncbi:hypothetical protein ACE6H2_022952 [Prunus campanulata]